MPYLASKLPVISIFAADKLLLAGLTMSINGCSPAIKQHINRTTILINAINAGLLKKMYLSSQQTL